MPINKQYLNLKPNLIEIKSILKGKYITTDCENIYCHSYFHEETKRVVLQVNYKNTWDIFYDEFIEIFILKYFAYFLEIPRVKQRIIKGKSFIEHRFEEEKLFFTARMIRHCNYEKDNPLDVKTNDIGLMFVVEFSFDFTQ